MIIPISHLKISKWQKQICTFQIPVLRNIKMAVKGEWRRMYNLNMQVHRVMGDRWIRVLGRLLRLNLVGIERRRRDMGKGVGVLLCDLCYK
jgi:hypothetical protein